MKTVGKDKTYEFEIIEVRKYSVQGNGHSKFEAEQDAIERFHRLSKSNGIVADYVGRPQVGKGVLHK